jgi:hypothetical protein
MNNYNNDDDDDRCHGTHMERYKDDVMMTTTMSDVTFSTTTTTGWNTMSRDSSSIPTTILTTTTMDETVEWSPDVTVSAAATTQWHCHDDTPNDHQWPLPSLVSTATLSLDDDYEPLGHNLEAEPIRPQLLPIMLDDDGDDALLLAGLEEHTFSSSSLDDLLLMDQFLGMDDGDNDDWL